MRCAQLRTALSARLDGEPAGVPDRRLDKHVARCAACREWLERAERLRGPLGAGRTGGPSEEWTAGLLARLGTATTGGSGGTGGDGATGGTGGTGADGGAGEGGPGQGDGRRTG
ncbi:zf-HC2 domain-containing protein [Kitasatospora sp. NPDC056327]|uniref:zf-HC2 domain-containing protein n=1 Tax=Kitasatospora sp. NPDC056327 TaxID=3345785 RepID=UPI0035DAB591